MKQRLLPFAICLSVICISCNNTGDNNNTAADSPSLKGPDTANQNNNNTNNNMSNTPLTREDSTFVMEAAIGGMMEVESGQLAQQNAANQRVKAFGAMMVTDHSKSNDELKSFASSRGMTLPTELPADKKKHLESMKAMKGKAFDNHYMTMMNEDHRKTIDLFQKQANSGGDAQLKTWAQNTLPVLQKHLDSAQAIKKGM
jgi:putative membrane protein